MRKTDKIPFEEIKSDKSIDETVLKFTVELPVKELIILMDAVEKGNPRFAKMFNKILLDALESMLNNHGKQ